MHEEGTKRGPPKSVALVFVCTAKGDGVHPRCAIFTHFIKNGGNIYAHRKKYGLRIAKLEERQLIYEMGLSTDYMKGRFALDFPDGFASFEENYDASHFDNQNPSVCGRMIISVDDKIAGFISYCSISLGEIYLKPGVMEMDIWMKGEEYGHDAVLTLANHFTKA